MSGPQQTPPSTSFTTRRINASTFVIQEDDAFGEQPLIYVKVHPKCPVIIVCDTGCDQPNEEHEHDEYIHLRKYLEHYPVKCNHHLPLNPNGTRQYIIICTHSHFDHTLGITQFIAGGTTEVIASAAGRDFIESDLEGHGLFQSVGKPVPYYTITLWAQAFEKLKYLPKGLNSAHSDDQVDLGITIIQTPGHTPDELAWYDHEEMHLYVGDSFYQEGHAEMPIIWPSHGNLVEWAFSMQKLYAFVQSENARAEAAMTNNDEDDWIQVPKRVLVSCGHQTVSADGEDILKDLDKFWWRVIRGEIPVVETRPAYGELCDWWREKGTNPDPTSMSFMAPRRLMEDA
ncbi:Hypothetical protein R9X50_00180200 [Acrodontium crateriforme]|uniref:Metallo-beta-lactamase domain-containing protein n=1 Tax=Acrodontium crateriforme TaxID=150365 RepID=A0AAQ3R318_9PEZI|nr:Hypothetical protein R9X50_00180200 [Acrodontium crateriforme]